MLAHELINSLSVIVGRCDLLEQESELEALAAAHLKQIRDVAKGMAEKLCTHQCQLALLMGTASPEKEGAPTKFKPPGAAQSHSLEIAADKGALPRVDSSKRPRKQADHH
jgi:hypothetical protein